MFFIWASTSYFWANASEVSSIIGTKFKGEKIQQEFKPWILTMRFLM